MRESATRLETAVTQLHGELEELRSYVERGFERQQDDFEKLRDQINGNRERVEKRLADRRTRAEENFKDLRTSLEQGFAEFRSEAKVTRRWLIGIAVSIVIAEASIATKLMYIA